MTSPPAGLQESLPPADRLSVIRLSSILVRYLPVIGLCAVTAMIGGLVLAIRIPHTYTATTTFLPNGRKSAPRVTGLAAQLGISLPSSGSSESPEFYTELLESRAILKQVALSRYAPPGSGDSVSLLEVLKVRPGDSLSRLATARSFLRGAIRPSVSTRTGLISVAVTTEAPWLSTAVAAHLLTAVDDFNRRTQREQSEAERRFAEVRLAEAAKDLESAEAQLQEFRQRNRAYNEASSAGLGEQRLARQIELRHAVFLSLAQGFEQARIESARDVSALSVIEPPEPPTGPDPRTTRRRGLFAAFLGALLGIVYMMVREYILHSRRHRREEVAEFISAARTVTRTIRRPGSLIRGGKDGAP